MNLNQKIIISFVVVSLSVGFTVFLYEEELNKDNEKLHLINNVELTYDNQKSYFLSFLRGNEEEEKITEMHNEIQQNIDLLTQDSSDKEQSILQNIQKINFDTYQKMLDSNTEDSTINLIIARNIALEEFMTRNNMHVVRISEYKNYWGDTAPTGLLDNILYNIDKERTVLLNFKPSNDNWSEVRDEFRNTNDFVVANLVSLLVDELDFHISLINADDPQLQEIKDSLISQRDIALRIDATSFPAITNTQSTLSKMPKLDMMSQDKASNTTVMFGEKCEENIIELENYDLPVRQRHDVKEVGNNKNTIQVLISVIKCQQELRSNAENYMNAELEIQKHLVIFYPDLDVKFHHEVKQLHQMADNSHEPLSIFGMLFVPLIGGIVIFGIFVSKSLTKPLKVLQKTMTNVAGGNYDIQISSKGTDEFSQLSKSFNTMTKAINKSQKTIKKQYEELKEFDKKKDDFSSMISHELRTPLVPIKGHIEMLKDPDFGDLTNEQLESVKDIENNVSKLEELILDLVLFQQLDSGNFHISKEKFSVREFITELLKDYSLKSEKQIQYVVNPIEEIILEADKKLLKHALDHLIKNAIDFVPENNGKIEISVHQEGRNIVFSVKDNGSGIPQNELDSIFEKFYQIETGERRTHGGMGIGLAISKGIVERHGGKIWAQSEKGKGTSVFISIPIID